MTVFSTDQKEFLENLFQKLNDKIEEKTNEVKTEIKEKIDHFEKEIKSKISDIEIRINTLELKNKGISQQFLNIERKLRKNNLAIFGIQETETNALKAACNIFQNLLQIPIEETDINDAYRLNANFNNKSPVIVEFVSYQKKLSILKETKKLKGTNIYISKDQCTEDRNNNKILVKHLKEARNKGIGAYIKGNKLYISNEPYTAKQLEEGIEESTSNGQPQKPQSAPTTPASNYTNIKQKTKRQDGDSEEENQSEHKKQKWEALKQQTKVITRSISSSSTKK